jgi:HEAT repeat protein
MKIRFQQDKRTILQILKSGGMKRKIRVLDKLNGVNERDSINILLKVLEDKSWVLREKAAHKLPQYGKKVVPRLTRLLTRGYWYTRAAACIALGEINSLRPLGAIIELLLHEENPTVIKEAIATLIKLKHNNPERFQDAFIVISLDATQQHHLGDLLKPFDPDFFKNPGNADNHE